LSFNNITRRGSMTLYNVTTLSINDMRGRYYMWLYIRVAIICDYIFVLRIHSHIHSLALLSAAPRKLYRISLLFFSLLVGCSTQSMNLYNIFKLPLCHYPSLPCALADL